MSKKVSMAQIVKTKLIMTHLPWTRKSFLKLNICLLGSLGYSMGYTRWSRSQCILAYFKRALLMGLTLFLALYNLYDIFSNIYRGRVVQGIQGLSLPLISLTGVISHLHFMINKRKVERLIAEIDDMVQLSLGISSKLSTPLLDKYSFASNFITIFLYTTIPLAALSHLQIPFMYLITHRGGANYTEIPMCFEVYYGTSPRESPTVFWMIAFVQSLQMMLSLAYFTPILSCYLSIVNFLHSMNEITNLYFKHFFISPEDSVNTLNDEEIPLRGVLILHQSLLKAMEFFSSIVSTLIFIAFSLGVIFLAVSFFEIFMFGFDPQNSKAALIIAMSLIVTFSIMWFFQTISELTSQPLDILYFRPWYKIKDQKILTNIMFVMIRTTKRVKYTLGGLSTEACMDTFVNLLKCAFSYTSLLKETKGRIDRS